MPGGEEAKRHYYSSVLFCEGKDAKGFFAGLRRHLQVDVVRIEDIRGRDRLGPRLRAVLQGEGGQLVERVAVTLDAHTNPDGAFQAIQDALVAAGWPRPVRPLEEVVCGNDGRAVMAMVLPDSESEGQLEELCLRACGDKPVYQAAINLVGEINREHNCKFDKLPKRQMQTVMAVMAECESAIQHSALKRHWPWDHDAFDEAKQLVRWVAQGSKPLN